MAGRRGVVRGGTLAPVIAALVSSVAAEVPPVVPPAFLTEDHSADWEPGQLLYRQVGLGRTTVVTYHNGVLYAGGYAGSPYDGFEWADTTDATSLSLTMAAGVVPIGIATTSGTHGHSSKMGDYILPGVKRTSTPGVNIENADFEDDFTDSDWGTYVSPSSAQQRPAHARPSPFHNNGGQGMHGGCWPWGIPFRWPQYGAANGNAWVWRADELVGGGGWDMGTAGVLGPTLLAGNLLLVCSDETFAGVAAWDLGPMFETPAQPPVLLDKLDGVIGGYLPAIWRNYIVMPTNGRLQLIDFSDPSNLVHSGDIVVPGIPGHGGQDYVQFQDHYAFYKGSKVDMETGNVVLELDWEDVGNRPAGSVAGKLNATQYLMPLGNLLATGGRGTAGEDGVGLWVHQDAPDTTRPRVGYHLPRPNQTNYPRGAAITLMIHESLESYTIVPGESVILREAGGSTPLDCWMSFSHDDLLTITPKQYLAADTEYVLEVVDGGIKDLAGNGIVGHSFNFSTGSVVSGNQLPVIDSVAVDASPTEAGAPIDFTVAASDPEGSATLEYRINFGDGTPVAAWSASATVFQHAYAAAGHYEVKVQVREQGNPALVTTEVLVITVAPLPSGPAPTKSSPLALDEANGRLWVVNPDNDSVSRIDTVGRTLELEVDLASELGVAGSIDPRALALDASGNVWVACRDADRVAILDGGSGALIASVACGHGAAPVGVAATPDGAAVFVTMEGRGHEAAVTDAAEPGHGKLVRYDAGSYGAGVPPSESGSLELGPKPRAIAVFGSGERVLVTRFVSGAAGGGEVWDVAAPSGGALSLTRTIFLPVDTSTVGFGESDLEPSNGDGVPNYVSSITISPDEAWAWYTATKPDTGRGSLDGRPLDPDNSVRTIVGRIELDASPEDDDESRIDFDNADSASAVAFSPRGDWGFVTAQGNNLVGVFDHLQILADPSLSARNTRVRWSTGLAPQGILLDGSGQLWTHDFMERSVTVFEVGDFLERGELAPVSQTIATVSAEKLAPAVLSGKRIFYNSGDDRMSDEGYISCASCHFDGMHDGRVWDFTQRGEGLRNTTDLRGRGGMAHGNVHWSANFDEIHDFENDIRNDFGGHGFLDPGDFSATEDPLGAAKAGLSTELDDLAAYVGSLGEETLPKSPYRNFDGTMSAEASAGAVVFAAQDCASCHDPASGYTDSVVGDGLAGLHDVGTLRASSGERLGGGPGSLGGIDTPTVMGVWDGAPFFHNGSAATLDEVFLAAGGIAHQAEDGTLLGGADERHHGQANSVSGAFGGIAVRCNGVGKGVAFSGIDGGSGGVARIELRYAARVDGVVDVSVNGVPLPAVAWPKTQEDNLDAAHWRVAVFEATLNAGAGNSIEVVVSSGGGWLDQMHVATADDFAAADAHTRVAGIAANDRAALIAYLLELEDSGPPPDPEAPQITQQPVDVTTREGLPAALGVVATGVPAVNYQWRKGGVELPGENGSQLDFGFAQQSEVGRYDVVVSNSEGSVTSDGVWLVVLPQVGDAGYAESSGVVSIEAEHGSFDDSGGASVWEIVGAIPTASNATYIETDGADQTGTAPDGSNAGRRDVDYRFTLPAAGDRDFYLRVEAASGSDDSCFFRLLGPGGGDSGWRQWNSLSGVNWSWNAWGGTDFDGLAAGDYTLRLTYRENGTRIDKLVIQQAGLPAPSGIGPAESPWLAAGIDYPGWAASWPWLNPGVDDLGGADPNRDGIVNELAFIADIDPLRPNHGLRVVREAWLDEHGTATPDDDQFVLRFRRRSEELEGMRVRCMSSGNLLTTGWEEVDFELPGHSLEVADADPDGDGSAVLMEARIARDGADRLFVVVEAVEE